MCDEEMQHTLRYKKLAYISGYKWFGTFDFVTSRVQDGKFNNSRFVKTRYANLLEFEFDTVNHFEKVGYREYMLSRRKANLVKILDIRGGK